MNKIDTTGWTTSETLETLATYLEKVQPEAFYMERWAKGERAPTFEDLSLPRVEENHCGTSACALGTAATIFEGLEIGDYYGSFYVKTTEQEAPAPLDIHNVSFRAGKLFFGITEEESRSLFQPLSYSGGNDTKPKVIARIRDLAATYRARGQ